MIPTKEYIEQRVAYFNATIFGNQLPPIPVYLSNAKTFLGQFACKKRKTLFGAYEYSDFQLRINTRIETTQEELDDTIIHEMIHYFIAYKQITDTSSHGEVFRKLMNQINQNYNRHITISHKNTAIQSQQAHARKTWHVVAVVKFKDGRVGVKVIPRILQRITFYYNNVTKNSSVESVRLFFSNDVFFNRFPNSGKLSANFVEDTNQLFIALQSAKELICDGKHLRYKQV